MFDEAHSQIDDQQKRLEALDTKPDDSKVMFGSKDYADTYIQKVDDFQDFVKKADVPDELKKQQFEDVAKFLKGIDAGTSAWIEQFSMALITKLSDFRGRVEALDGELEKRHEVQRGDTVPGIVESKLGIKWKDDPARFFAGVRFLQEKRQNPGCILKIEDGKVKWEAGPSDPNQLEVGEYFVTDGLSGVATGTLADVDWYLGFSSSAPYGRAIRQEVSKRATSGAAEDLMSASDIDAISGDPAAIDGLQSKLSGFAVMRDFSSIWKGNVDAAQAMAVTLPEEARDRVNDRLAQISHILSEMLKEAQKSSPDKAAVQELVDSLGPISDEVDQLVVLEGVFESVRPRVEEAQGCVDVAERLLRGEEVSETLYSGLSVSQLCLSAQGHYGEAYRALSEHLVVNQEVLSPSSIEEVLLEMDALKQEILGVEELQNVPKLQRAVADYPEYFVLHPETMAIVGNEKFQALSEPERQRIMDSVKEDYGISDEDRILELNAEFCPPHQAEFHEGRQLMVQGEMTKAKPHLLAYVQAVEGGPFESYEAGNLEIAKDHLVLIGQFEIAEMRGYLQKMQESLQLYLGGTLHKKRGLELTPLEALPMLQTMSDVLNVCEAALISGAVLTVEEARANIVASGKGTDQYLRSDSLQAFQRDRRFVDQIEGGVFDVFTLFERLNVAEGAEAEREAVLELARYYRENGLPQVASLLFDQYFAEEYQTLQKENPTLRREYFEQEFERDPKLREDLDKKFEKQLEGIIEDQLDGFRDVYEEENGVSISKKEARQLLSEKITGEEKTRMKDQLKDQIITDRWQAALKIAMINKRETTGVKDIFTEEYNDMMEFDRSWYEFWRMTDSQFDSLMENLWVEIVSLLLSFGVASRVSTTVMRRAVTRQLTKKIGKEVAEEMVEKALREGGEEAVKALGRQMLGRGAMMGVGATAFAGENTAFVVASGGLNGMRSGDFSQFTSVEGFAKAWGHSALTLGTLKGVGSAYGGTVGRLGTSPASMAGRSAVGQLGIRGGHMLGMNTAQVMALTGLGAGEMYLHGELTQGAVAESILQNTLITVAFTAAHAPQGRFQGRPVRGIEGQSPAEIARRLVSEHEASLRPASGRGAKRDGEEIRVPETAERAEELVERAEESSPDVLKVADKAPKVADAAEVRADFRASLKGAENLHLGSHFHFKSLENGESMLTINLERVESLRAVLKGEHELPADLVGTSLPLIDAYKSAQNVAEKRIVIEKAVQLLDNRIAKIREDIEIFKFDEKLRLDLENAREVWADRLEGAEAPSEARLLDIAAYTPEVAGTHYQGLLGAVRIHEAFIRQYRLSGDVRRFDSSLRSSQFGVTSDRSLYDHFTGADSGVERVAIAEKSLENIKRQVDALGDRIEVLARERYAQEGLDLTSDQIRTIVRRHPQHYMEAMEIYRQMPQKARELEEMGLTDCAEELLNFDNEFSRVDGAELSTPEYRLAYAERLRNLSPLELKWYRERPRKLPEQGSPDYGAAAFELKNFTADFVSEHVLPDLIRQNMPLETLIQQIHTWQTRGSSAQLEILGSGNEGHDISGRYREIYVSVGSYRCPPPERVPAMMEAFSAQVEGFSRQMEAARTTMTPEAYEQAVVRYAAFVHQRFVEIHPMRDGNGRTSRMLYEYIVIKHLGPENRYRRIPMDKRPGEPTMDGTLQDYNHKFSQDYLLEADLLSRRLQEQTFDEMLAGFEDFGRQIQHLVDQPPST